MLRVGDDGQVIYDAEDSDPRVISALEYRSARRQRTHIPGVRKVPARRDPQDSEPLSPIGRSAGRRVGASVAGPNGVRLGRPVLRA